MIDIVGTFKNFIGKEDTLFQRNLRVGKRAENIAKQMFKEAGYTVFKYGSEHTVGQIANFMRENKIKSDTARFIRHQPDFVVVNNRNEAYFVEVKFRSNG